MGFLAAWALRPQALQTSFAGSAGLQACVVTGEPVCKAAEGKITTRIILFAKDLYEKNKPIEPSDLFIVGHLILHLSN
jgi:hypothetical protein